ncbi:hypothetical protein [Streptomyces albidochromogenes]|uniref:Uncharacterized protein n=1 Tax=Streptomyces albidochromogenes TaxID=329524 RepID=A0ABW6FX13_9ACTN
MSRLTRRRFPTGVVLCDPIPDTGTKPLFQLIKRGADAGILTE